jgi:hypothetical protein
MKNPYDIEIRGVVRSNDGLQAHYVASDPKASYTLINPKTDLTKYNPAMVEWVSPERTDYNLLPPDHLKPNYTQSMVANQGLPMSYLQVETVEQGTEWYKANTKYPDEVCEMLAKYEWGDLKYTTKKEFRNLKKKTFKKKQKQKGMTARHNETIILDFD